MAKYRRSLIRISYSSPEFLPSGLVSSFGNPVVLVAFPSRRSKPVLKALNRYGIQCRQRLCFLYQEQRAWELHNEKALPLNQYFNVTSLRGKPGTDSCFFSSAEQTLQSAICFSPYNPRTLGHSALPSLSQSCVTAGSQSLDLQLTIRLRIAKKTVPEYPRTDLKCAHLTVLIRQRPGVRTFQRSASF